VTSNTITGDKEIFIRSREGRRGGIKEDAKELN